MHNMFVLQHLAHHHMRLGTPLYVSLLDVKGAYDTTVHGHIVLDIYEIDHCTSFGPCSARGITPSSP